MERWLASHCDTFGKLDDFFRFPLHGIKSISKGPAECIVCSIHVILCCPACYRTGIADKLQNKSNYICCITSAQYKIITDLLLAKFSPNGTKVILIDGDPLPTIFIAFTVIFLHNECSLSGRVTTRYYANVQLTRRRGTVCFTHAQFARTRWNLFVG